MQKDFPEQKSLPKSKKEQKREKQKSKEIHAKEIIKPDEKNEAENVPKPSEKTKAESNKTLKQKPVQKKQEKKDFDLRNISKLHLQEKQQQELEETKKDRSEQIQPKRFVRKITGKASVRQFSDQLIELVKPLSANEVLTVFGVQKYIPKLISVIEVVKRQTKKSLQKQIIAKNRIHLNSKEQQVMIISISLMD